MTGTDELQQLRDDRDKFMWQVRDTCARAEKAEAELARLRGAAIPSAIREQVLSMGRVEWGATDELTAAGHLAHLENSLRLTREHFNYEDVPVAMHGLYLEGTGTVLCHTGTSPNSGTNAQALAGAWNQLHDLCAGISYQTERKIPCPHCDGEGRIEHPHMPLHGLHGETPEYAIVDCEECDGTGKIWTDEDQPAQPPKEISTMTHDALAAGELQRLLDAATKGEWRRRGRGSPHIDIVADEKGDDNPLVTLHEAGACGSMAERRAEALANADLIIAAKKLLPTLLADLTAANARVEEAEGAIRPFAKMGKLLDGPFGPALFKDEDTIGVGGAWSENGKPRSITFGDLRKAAQWLADREGRS